MKRIFDFCAALIGLLVALPVLIAVAIVIWLQDFHSPFYVAARVAKGGRTFKMVKFRSMVVGADKIGVNSTSGDDRRVTPIGRFVRAYKIDELMQLWNVLKGDMSLVGPRPQVPAAVSVYTDEERRMLSLSPGITDPASIVFSDEADILHGSNDPELLYHQIIRPWKSRLALLYLSNRTFWADLQLIFLTLCRILSRKIALRGLQSMLRNWTADSQLCHVALRNSPLYPYPPPGATEVVTELGYVVATMAVRENPGPGEAPARRRPTIKDRPA